MTKTARFHDNVSALAALRFGQAQIVDGHVTDTAAGALLLNAVQSHVRALLECAPRPRLVGVRRSPVEASPVETATLIIETAAMTDAELHAHYRRTAPVEDLRFFLRHACLSDDLRIKAEALDARGLHRVKRTAWYDELATLRQQWGRERQDAERAERKTGQRADYADRRARAASYMQEPHAAVFGLSTMVFGQER